jgi:hypothetical protein
MFVMEAAGGKNCHRIDVLYSQEVIDAIENGYAESIADRTRPLRDDIAYSDQLSVADVAPTEQIRMAFRDSTTAQNPKFNHVSLVRASPGTKPTVGLNTKPQ